MAPAANESKPMYQKDEKALCFHGELLYEAKVLEVRRSDPKDKTSPHEYRVHYKGWKNTWDDWVPQDRLRKLTDDNKELAANLRRELTQQSAPKSTSKPSTTSKHRKQGSEFGSGRGSEERNSSVPAGGRGTKRGRDNDIEKVGRKSPLRLTPSTREFFEKYGPAKDSVNVPRGPTTLRDIFRQFRDPQIAYSSSSSSDLVIATRSKPFLSPKEREVPSNARLTSQAAALNVKMMEVIPPASAGQPIKASADFDNSDATTKRVLRKKAEQRFRAASVNKDCPVNNTMQYPPLTIEKHMIQRGNGLKEPVEHILARPAPPDEPEFISSWSARNRLHLYSAPLIGGTTQEEKAAIENELRNRGKLQSAQRDHPGWIKTKIEDAGNFSKLLFYEGQNPEQRMSIAGVPDIPTHIDPPGHDSPFEALKYPDRLIEVLNRGDEQTLWGWDTKALLVIPRQIMLKIRPEVLSTMHYDVLIKQSQQVIDLLPRDAPFFKQLPTSSKLRRPGQISQIKTKTIATRSALFPNLGVTKPPERCTTCFKMSIKCNSAKPRCFWCTHNNYMCSFEKVAYEIDYDTVMSTKEPEEDAYRAVLLKRPIKFATSRQTNGYGVPKGTQVAPTWKRPHATNQPSRPCSSANISEQPTRRVTRSKVFPQDFLAFDLCIDSADLPSSTPPFSRKSTQAYISASGLQEESFHTRPSIRITIPDHLKNLLVDDWENVTKSLLLVPLPSQAPANFIIDTYWNEEKVNRRLGSAEADVLEEFCAGMKVYFEKSVGKILLYRFERGQLADIRKLWESGKFPEWEGRGPGDCYGAEHLTRMLVNMPELIAQTNMDAQSVARLKEEISKFCTWLARNSTKFFCAMYEKPTAEYVENAR